MKEIAIITGGDSAEREISISSAKVVLDHLDKRKYTARIIDIKNDNWTISIKNKKININKEDFSVNIQDKKIKFEYVFIALHGPPAENGLIQGYFDNLKVPYSSCDANTSSITFNKIECNKRLTSLGFRCARSLCYKRYQKINIEEIINKLGLPCFIKPNQSGSSFGVSKIKEAKNIPEAIQQALIHDNIVLIEEFLDGKELSCGVMQKDNRVEALPITEIISENEFFDYQAKYQGLSQEITPARINNNLTKKIKRISEDIFIKMKLKGVCRIDFILIKDIPYIIEINTIPGLSKESIIPKQAKEAGISLCQLFNLWINTTLNK